MKKFFLIFGIIAFFSAQSFSQVSIKNTVGANVFFGDLSDSKNISFSNSISAGLFLTESGAVRGNVLYESGKLNGQKDDIKSGYVRRVNEFENEYKELSINLNLYPLKMTRFADSKFQPYVMLGYGFMWFRVVAYTEYGDFFSQSFGYENRKSVDPTCEVVVPHGVGLSYECSPNLAFSIDVNRMYVESDKLDAVVSEKKDVFGSVSLGVKYTIGNDSEKKHNKPIQSKERVASDDSNDDYDSEDEEIVAKPAKSKPSKVKEVVNETPVVVENCDEYKAQLAKKDAQIKVLQDSIYKLSNIPESLKVKYCRKYLNGLLYRKCDAEVIKSNLEILDSARIHDENIDKYKYLLRNYESWYNEFLTVVEYAQNDSRRYSPLTSESSAFKNDVVTKINNLSYNKRSVANWKIYYLEDQILLVKKRLDEKVKHPEVIIDFSDMLK